MERRNFLKAFSILGAPGSAVAAPQPTSELDQLLAATEKSGWVEFNQWKVLWTGWKKCHGSIDVAGQWVLAPTVPLVPFEKKDCVFCIPYPGVMGFLHRGDAVNLTMQWPQQVWVIDGAYSKHDPLRTARRLTGQVALDVMRRCYFSRYWDDYGEKFSFMWNRLCWQSKFYIYPEKYAREVIRPNASDNMVRAFMENCQRRIYTLQEL